MKRFALHVSLMTAAGVLLVGSWFLTTARLEYCGQIACPRGCRVSTMAGGPSPTLAPPQGMVLVRVEADRSDLEVGWLE